MTWIQPNSHDANSAPAALEAGQEEVPAVNSERGGSPSHASPTLLLEYLGAFVLDAGDCIRIVLCKFNKRSDLRRTLHQAGFENVRPYVLECPRSDAAISSARAILWLYYGEQVK